MADLLNKKAPSQTDEGPGDYEFYRAEKGSPARAEEDEFLKQVGIQRNGAKQTGRPPRFSFAVPMKASGHVAFQLAKAGMKDFEVVHFKEDETSVFAFQTEPDMHVAEEIVKAEFADQIASQKGMWKTWADQTDITALPEPEGRAKPPQYVSSWDKEAWQARQEGKVAGQWGDRSEDSDSVHDVLDKFRHDGSEGANVSFDDALPEGVETNVLESMKDADDDTFLGVVVWMVSHGDKVPQVYRERAAMIAEAMLANQEYLREWQNPKSREAELEREIDMLRKSASKTALLLPDDLKYINTALAGPGMTDEEIKKMDKYRDKKLHAWVEELGLDLDKEMEEYRTGDFWTRDRIYEEVRDMIKEERGFQNYYRRTMRGPRPYNRRQQ